MAGGHPFRAVLWLGAIAFMTHLTVQESLAPVLLLSTWFLQMCDSFALARKKIGKKLGQPPTAPPQKLNPDKIFLGLVTAGIGSVFLLQNSIMPSLSIVLMWPVATVLFGLSLAMQRS